MEIILKETIDTLGQEGSIVKVKSGYARNFLIPQKKAVLVSKATLARLEHEKQNIASRLAEQQKKAEGLSAQLQDKVVVIAKRVGDEGRLFGSVTNGDVAAALLQEGIQVDKRSVVLPDAIKTIGEYSVQIKAGYQKIAQLQVQVVEEGIEVK